MSSAVTEHRLVQVTGVVQGVGFRPFVHRLATQYGLDGWVRNQSGDVVIAIDGAADAVHGFLRDLVVTAPPLAKIEDIRSTTGPGTIEPGFRILESLSAPDRRQPVPADVATCEACLRELFDPTDRRHRFPFITCTDCGPRYTVIESLPYDRERTTMRAFTQCATCRREYETPGNRRHHSETNSCVECGPRLRVALPGGEPVRAWMGGDAELAISVAAAFIAGGSIVAIRGVGGFHLAVDATSRRAVERLRERKHREHKPFAIMVRTIEDARALAHISPDEERLLLDRTRPVVLLRRRDGTRVIEAVAPGLDTIGIMLAYTPLHHLLLDELRRPVVMTSGNLAEEPIAADIGDARARLGGIADLFLLHDREIVSPVDDSVMRIVADRPSFVRRARGHAPLPLALETTRHILAVGGQLKCTFTLAAGSHAYVSPHLGDLDSLETLRHYRATLQRYTALFRVEPRVIARDMHPGYLSTSVAEDFSSDAVIAVQHHHAHVAAVLGEHRIDEPVLGIAFDGTGYGDDGTVWGAEFLIADQSSYRRVGHLRAAPLPGGELAVRSPWRSALGYLSLEPALAAAFTLAFDGVSNRERDVAVLQLHRGLNSPLASSMGRLFDAAAAVLGVLRHSRFEGEAGMLLESLAGTRYEPPLPLPIRDGIIDPLPLLAALGEQRRAGVPVEQLAAAFHESVAAASAELVCSLGMSVVALGGGVFQNARLARTLRDRLETRGLRVLMPIHLPANDGGLSYGQAVVAAARLRGE
jgi:hydrogenase maturation protein HypF